MGIVQGFKCAVAEIREGRPGRRFTAHYRRQRERSEARWRSVLIIGCGLCLVAAGALLGLVPGAPGIVLGVPGIAMIAARSPWVARGLDRLELAARRVAERWRRRHYGV